MDETELVERAQQGDEQALEQLLGTHYSSWYQLCRRMMGNDADAADATQDAMIAVLKGLHRFDGRAKFSTWSYRVVMNRCHDALRRRNRTPLPADLASESSVASTSSHRLESSGGDPAHQVVTSIDLDEKLEQLSEDYRTILVLRDLVGCDYAEMADVLSIPIGTVRSRLARARTRLSELYAQDNALANNESVVGGNFSSPSSVKPVDL